MAPQRISTAFLDLHMRPLTVDCDPLVEVLALRQLHGHCPTGHTCPSRAPACPPLTVDCHPLVEVLALRQLHGQAQVTGAQRGGGVLHQVVLPRTLRDVLLGLERLVGPAAAVEGGEGGA